VSSLEALTAATFARLRGDRFRIAPGDSPDFEVELVHVTEGAAEGPSRTQFALVFRGGPDPPLRQRIYRLEHDELGALDLFLVPLGPDELGQRYEAVFT
jgi:hypothetical protein